MSYEKALQAVNSLPGVNVTEQQEKNRIKFTMPGSPLDAFKVIGAALGGKFSLGYFKYENGLHHMSVTPWREFDRTEREVDELPSGNYPGGFAKGDRVKVVRGRKVPIGTEGTLFWSKPNQYSRTESYRIGIRDDEGKVHWTYDQNIELVRAVGSIEPTPEAPRPISGSESMSASVMDDPFAWLPATGN